MNKKMASLLLLGLSIFLGYTSQAQESFSTKYPLKTVEKEKIGLAYKVPKDWKLKDESVPNDVMQASIYNNETGKMIFAVHIFKEIPFQDLEEALSDFISNLKSEEDELTEVEKIEVNKLDFISRQINSDKGHIEARMLAYNDMYVLCYAIVGNDGDEDEFQQAIAFLRDNVMSSFQKLSN